MIITACDVCTDYFERRGEVLLAEVERVADERKIPDAKLAAYEAALITYYAEGVHARHLAGGSLR